MTTPGPLLLVVNDDGPSLYLLARHLRGGGYRVPEARSGADALDRAARDSPALVVLDVKLPDVSGYEVARLLRAGPATARDGIVFVSASYEAAEVRSGDGAGDAYLAQPVDDDTLLTTVRLVLASRGAE